MTGSSYFCLVQVKLKWTLELTYINMLLKKSGMKLHCPTEGRETGSSNWGGGGVRKVDCSRNRDSTLFDA